MWFWFKQLLVGEGALRDEPKIITAVKETTVTVNVLLLVFSGIE